MKNWKRTLLVGLVWGFFLIGCWARFFFSTNWQLDIFSFGHWQFLLDEYRKGWAIKSTSDWVFICTLVALPVIYIWGWKYALEVKWINLLHKITNKIIYFFTGNSTPKQQVKLSLNKNSSKNTRPKAMDSSLVRPIAKNTELKVPVEEGEYNSQQNMGLKPSFSDSKPSFSSNHSGFSFDEPKKNSFSAPFDSPFTGGFSAPSMKQSFSIAPKPSDEDDFDKILLEDIKLPERIPLDEDLEDILTSADYQLIPQAKLGDIPLDYLAVGKNKILVCKIDTEDGDWLADEEKFNGEDPLWFSESSHRVSPIFNLIEQTAKFSERLKTFGYNGKVQPIFIVKTGNIINAEDMLTTWKDLNVMVCRTDKGGPDELDSFADTILPDSQPNEEIMTIVQNAL